MLFRFGKRGALQFPKAYIKERALRARDMPTVPLYWFTAIENWGDLVGPYLVKKITGAEPIPAYSSKRPHLLAVGSILARSTGASRVWGAGFISENETLTCSPSQIAAVRGLHSLRMVEQFGFSAPEVVGDPALLMPRFYLPMPMSKHTRIGLIPHYAELTMFRDVQLPPGVRIIDVRKGVEAFVDDLCSCEVVLSSSLHGLIAADAYSIPNLWIEFSGKVIGGGFKFNDYYSSLDEPDTSPHIVAPDKCNELIRLANLASRHKPYRHGDALLGSFPWSLGQV